MSLPPPSHVKLLRVILKFSEVLNIRPCNTHTQYIFTYMFVLTHIYYASQSADLQYLLRRSVRVRPQTRQNSSQIFIGQFSCKMAECGFGCSDWPISDGMDQQDMSWRLRQDCHIRAKISVFFAQSFFLFVFSHKFGVIYDIFKNIYI